jgi:ATP/maltotriose-dependent transcriptional regulator MalT
MEKRMTLKILESDQIYNNIYELLAKKYNVRLLSISNHLDSNTSITGDSPDVLLVGARQLDQNLLRIIQESVHGGVAGVAILLNSYNQNDVENLRKIVVESRENHGFSFFMRQSINQLEQLFNIIKAVAHRQVILDPAITQCMFSVKDPGAILNLFTMRERDVLQLLAKGRCNVSIANELFIEVKTVEHHLNNIYSKIKSKIDIDDKHPRVAAARLYLEESGELNMNQRHSNTSGSTF